VHRTTPGLQRVECALDVLPDFEARNDDIDGAHGNLICLLLGVPACDIGASELAISWEIRDSLHGEHGNQANPEDVRLAGAEPQACDCQFPAQR
jgi:hypothetical protein